MALGAKQAYSPWSGQRFTVVVVAASIGRGDDLAGQSLAWIVLGHLTPVDLGYSD